MCGTEKDFLEKRRGLDEKLCWRKGGKGIEIVFFGGYKFDGFWRGGGDGGWDGFDFGSFFLVS